MTETAIANPAAVVAPREAWADVDPQRPVGLLTLVGFLCGRRDAITQIARSHAAWWVAVLFVLSAGFAREYDHEYLLAEPWHLLIPFAASIVMSWLLFSLLWASAKRGTRTPYVSGYLTFLKLFWMTAPMAWLYAIPYERMIDPQAALMANLWTLAFVAVWRVALISRVLVIMTGREAGHVSVIVLAVSDVAVQFAISFVELPLLAIMGGAGVSPRDLTLMGVTFLVRMIGVLAAIFLVPFALFLLVFQHDPMPELPAPSAAAGRTSLLLRCIAVVSVLIWAAFLPATQVEQRLRHEAMQLLKANRIADALAMMSRHERSAFPPQWDPPPRNGYEYDTPKLHDVMQALTDPALGSPWVRAEYVAKFESFWLSHPRFSPYQDEQLFAQFNRLLAELPEGPAIRTRRAEDLELLQRTVDFERERKDASTRPSTARSATTSTTQSSTRPAATVPTLSE